MLEELYSDISEKLLYDTYKQINKKIQIHGSAPSGFNGNVYTIDPNDSNIYNFTQSFLAYLNHNSNLLNFKYSIVTLPHFIIFYIDKINPTNLQLAQIPDVVKTYKMPLTATETYILQCNMSNIITFYDRMASEMNYLIQTAGFDKQLYFYQLLGVNNAQTNIFSFIFKGAINIKTLDTK